MFTTYCVLCTFLGALDGFYFTPLNKLYKLKKTDVHIKLLKIIKDQLQCEQLIGITTGFKVT